MAITERDLKPVKKPYSTREIERIEAAIADESQDAKAKIYDLVAELGRSFASINSKYYAVKRAVEYSKNDQKNDLEIKAATAVETLENVINVLQELKQEIRILEDFVQLTLKVKKLYGYELDGSGAVSKLNFQ